MIDVSPETSIGYVVLDSDLSIISHNTAYARIARREGETLIGRNFAEIFERATDFVDLMQLVLATGYVARVRAYPYTFMHGDVYEERYFDATVNVMNAEPNPRLLLRVTEVAASELTAEVDTTSILRVARARGVKPLLTGEDMEGRTVDLYMHPASALLRDRVAVLAVYRDSSYNITLEFDDSLFDRLALARALHVKS